MFSQGHDQKSLLNKSIKLQFGVIVTTFKKCILEKNLMFDISLSNVIIFHQVGALR